MIARMRTVPDAVAIIKEADPGTAVTIHFVRKLVNTGAFPCVPVGRKKLVNVDRLLDFLAQEQEEYNEK